MKSQSEAGLLRGGGGGTNRGGEQINRGGGGGEEERGRRREEEVHDSPDENERTKVKSHIRNNFKATKGVKISLKIADKKTSFNKIQKITLFPKITSTKKERFEGRKKEAEGNIMEAECTQQQEIKTKEEKGTIIIKAREKEEENAVRESKETKRDERVRENGSKREERKGKEGLRREEEKREKKNASNLDYIGRISKEFLNTIKGEEKFVEIFVDISEEKKVGKKMNSK